MSKLSLIALATIGALAVAGCSEKTQDAAVVAAEAASTDIAIAADKAAASTDELDKKAAAAADQVAKATDHLDQKAAAAADKLASQAAEQAARIEASAHNETVAEAKKD